jgi:Putative beta-barrel porin-2, OmpL-like. bbp2
VDPETAEELTKNTTTIGNKKMKCNQWTLGLAAIGVVSLASVAQAEEAKMSSVQTALASTTLSGFVDTSMQWNIGTGNTHAPGYGFGGGTKADGFNLNVVDLNLEKDPDAADTWGAGYRVELWMGPDASTLATQSPNAAGAGDFAVKNAYVELKAPIGTGLDAKIGVWDTIIGYEVADSPSNPNFTRSWGFTIEPTTHTGVLLAYTVNEMIALQAGIADTYGPSINQRAIAGGTGDQAEYYKTYLASIAFTAPTNWGWVGGSTAYGCIINGFNAASPGNVTGAVDQTSLYFGMTMMTPLKELKVGASYDYAGSKRQELSPHQSGYANAFDLYATYQVRDNLGFNTRIEYFDESPAAALAADAGGTGIAKEIFTFTETVEYDLWKNVMSRAEFRWDHALGGVHAFGGTGAGGFGTLENSVEVIGSLAYKF